MHREMKTNGAGQDVASNRRVIPKLRMMKFQLRGTCGHSYDAAWDSAWSGLEEWKKKQGGRACPNCRKEAHEKLMADQVKLSAQKADSKEIKKLAAFTKGIHDAPLLLPIGTELTAWHRPDGMWAGTVATRSVVVTRERPTLIALIWALAKAWLIAFQTTPGDAAP